jgi:hypothetical protein
VGEAGVACEAEAFADRASLAAIDRQAGDSNPKRRVVQRGQGRGDGGIAAVIDHEDRQPKAAQNGNDIADHPVMIVARDDGAGPNVHAADSMIRPSDAIRLPER